MKSTSNPLRFDSIFYAVSTSLLLATPVETIAYELQGDPTSPGFLQQPVAAQLSLDPLSASGLSLGTLNAFSQQMSERHQQPAPDLIASQWAQFFPTSARGRALPPAQLEAPSQQLMIGPDLFVRETAAGDVHRAGIFVGHNNLQSSFRGARPLLGDKQRKAVNLSGESLGVYWSMTHEQGWHLDAVAMGSRIDVMGRGENGQRLDDSGHAMTFSVEGGYPIRLGGQLGHRAPGTVDQPAILPWQPGAGRDLASLRQPAELERPGRCQVVRALRSARHAHRTLCAYQRVV